MSDPTPAPADLSPQQPTPASPLVSEAPVVYPPGHHDLMDPRDIASIEDWGHAG